MDGQQRRSGKRKGNKKQKARNFRRGKWRGTNNSNKHYDDELPRNKETGGKYQIIRFFCRIKKSSKDFVWDKGKTWKAVHVAGGGGEERGGGELSHNSWVSLCKYAVNLSGGQP